jgi:hypothetical protein
MTTSQSPVSPRMSFDFVTGAFIDPPWDSAGAREFGQGATRLPRFRQR